MQFRTYVPTYAEFDEIISHKAIRKLQGYEYKGMHITDVQEKLQELAYKEESEGKKPYLVLVKE